MPRNWFSKKLNFNNVKKDSIYNSFLISVFINKLQKNGKKSIAQKIFYKSLKIIKKIRKSKFISLLILEKAIFRKKRLFKFKLLKLNRGRYFKKIKNTSCSSVKFAINYLINKAKKFCRNKKTDFAKSLARIIIKSCFKKKFFNYEKKNNYTKKKFLIENIKKNKNKFNILKKDSKFKYRSYLKKLMHKTHISTTTI